MNEASDAPSAIAAAAARAPTSTRLYRGGALALEGFPVEDISEHLATPGAVVWLDLCAPAAADFDMINAEFGLHELAIEDALDESQRPKLDRYPHHLLISAYKVDLGTTDGDLTATEIAMFVTGQALITVRKGTAFDISNHQPEPPLSIRPIPASGPFPHPAHSRIRPIPASGPVRFRPGRIWDAPHSVIR